MSDKVIVYSVPRSASVLIYDLYIANGFESHYGDYEKYCMHTHVLNSEFFEGININEHKIVAVDRRDVFNQTISYLMAGCINEWQTQLSTLKYTYKTDKMEEGIIYPYTDKIERGTVHKKSVETFTKTLMITKYLWNKKIRELKEPTVLYYEDIIEDGLEKTCSRLNLDPTNCRWAEHKNPRKPEDVFVNYDDVKQWVSEYLTMPFKAVIA